MKNILSLAFLILLFNCSGSDDNSGPANPVQASLEFPDNNQECTEGVDVPGTNKSSVTFRWAATANTDSYDIVLKNLRTSATSVYNSTSNQLSIEIEKATPFSWYVISKSESVIETAISDTWKFYNAGDPVSSYAPFPADLISPSLGANLSGITSQTLTWEGTDIDNDIDDYNVYFDTANPPTTLFTTTSNTSANVSVTAGNTYYWRIVTNDDEGNNSQSEIYQFKVN